MTKRFAVALPSRLPGYLVALLVLLVLVAKWGLGPPPSAPHGDGAQNFRMAYNFALYGTLSLDEVTSPDAAGKALAPTSYREPLPSLVAAFSMRAARLLAGLTAEQLDSEAGWEVVRLSNILWAALLSLCVFGALRNLTGNAAVAAAAALLVAWQVELIVDWKDLGPFYTELQASALLALFSYLGLRAVQTGLVRHHLLCGLAAGALILTKGGFLYVLLGLVACLALWLVWRDGRAGLRRSAVNVIVLAVGVGALIGPWQARNYYHFGSASITERSGLVLLMRALKNQMTWTEYFGAFYFWADGLHRNTVRRALGFTSADLVKGGRLQRLNWVGEGDPQLTEEDRAAERAGAPEKALTYYTQARAERVRLTRELEAKGDPHPRRSTDDLLRQQAIQLILANPGNHLLATIPFLWRGAQFSAPLLALLAVVALMRGRRDVLVYMLPAIALIVFHALLSHNEPRYNAPANPVLIVAAIATLHAWMLGRARRLAVAPAAPAVRASASDPP